MTAAAPGLRSSSAPDFPTMALHGYLSALLASGREVERTLRAHVLPYLPTLAHHYAAAAGAAETRRDGRRMRVAVVGGPRTGKTTAARALADAHALPLRHADDLIPLGWSRASEQLAHEIRLSDGGVFEGVAIARALRKLLELEPGQPLDAVVRLRAPYAELTPGQAAMSAGHDRVLEAILPELERRGVRVLELPAQGLTARAALTFTAAAGITPRVDARDPLLGEIFARARAAHRFDVRPAALLAGMRVDEHVRTTLEHQVGEALGLPRYAIRAAIAPPRTDAAERTDAKKKTPQQKLAAKHPLAAIDPLTPGSPIAGKLDAFVKSNVARVGTMTDDVYAQAQDAVRKGLEQGLRPEALAAKLLTQAKGISQNQATIIANDAVGKFHGAQTQLRQQALGITHYRWRTVRDLKVRPGHRALEGTVQSWAEPPVTNPSTGTRAHPGFDTHYYACRCSASPIIDPATIAPPPDSPFTRQPGAPAPQLPLPSVPPPTYPRGPFPVVTERPKPAKGSKPRKAPAPQLPQLTLPPPTAAPLPPLPLPLPPTPAPLPTPAPAPAPAPDIPAGDQTLLAPLEYGVSDAQLAYLREGMRDLTAITSAYAGATAAEVDLIATGQSRTKTGQAFEPIVISVEPGYMELTDGRHRMAAARAAGATRILARIKTPGGREYLRVIPIPR
jgi:SPP1 gp7 family putative phage head morphogenesis protein